MFTLTTHNRLGGLHDSLWNIFDEMDKPIAGGSDSLWSYKENSDDYEYQFNLAGFKKENIKASVEDNVLKVRAKQEDRSFERDVSVPRKADSSLALAKYEDGILYIKINKNIKDKEINLEIL
jgi:HSP20 family molecular chaperone IbpA